MQENALHSKTKTSFYRRLYLAHLIETGTNTVPAICEATGMQGAPRKIRFWLFKNWI